jgi:UDP-2,4-diacetamido-2,4,6-trideoxy-beta-L-altropyranose hydrolase
MHVAFRTDSSHDIGTGHVMRCLALAHSLRVAGADCYFVCRAHQGSILDRITSDGFGLYVLPESSGERVELTNKHSSWLGVDWRQDATETSEALSLRRPTWLVADHYGLDINWETRVRSSCERLMVIDDLADRTHYCDVLLDQTFGRAHQQYQALVPRSAKLLVGPAYAMLRPEFSRLRAESIARRKRPILKQILVSMGGIDKSNVTCNVLDALDQASLGSSVNIVVVMGLTAPWLPEVIKRAEKMANHVEVKVSVSNMARLMADSDFAIGAGGLTALERCALGLPSFTFILAENQEHVSRMLERAGATITALPDVGGKLAVSRFLNDSGVLEKFSEMSCAAQNITDGLGLRRVVQALDASLA